MYRVTICCFLFMGNHYHMIIAGDANRVSSFAGYIDAEIAKRMIRLLPNRWGPKFWTGRFKEQHLASPEAVINKIIYTFSNPLRARLVSDLSTYPGASSIAALYNSDNKTSELCSFTFARFFKPLGASRISGKYEIELIRDLQEKSSGFHTLSTDLFAWTKCFKGKFNRSEILHNILSKIKENEFIAARQGVVGAQRLQSQAYDKPHKPEKKIGDRTPFVECPDEALRKAEIVSYQNFCAQCRYSWQMLKQKILVDWPRGAFVPAWRWQTLAHGTS
jgi:hypothetical protein